MRPRFSSRILRFSLWLGIGALFVQSLFPFLFAAEMRFADPLYREAAETRCIAENRGMGRDGQHHAHAGCTICLSAMAEFSRTAESPTVPLPGSRDYAFHVPAEPALTAPGVLFAYLSRGPPFQI